MQDAIEYSVLVKQHTNYAAIPYGELLECREWRERRKPILARDISTCTHCKKIETDSVYAKGERPIHFYHDVIEVEKYDSYGEFVGIGFKQALIRVNQPVHLHVHHKYYVQGALPWDYPDDALVTLCSECHTAYHQNNTVVTYEDWSFKVRLKADPCPRCYGAGSFPEFSHVQNGTCFYCKGARYLHLRPDN